MLTFTVMLVIVTLLVASLFEKLGNIGNIVCFEDFFRNRCCEVLCAATRGRLTLLYCDVSEQKIVETIRTMSAGEMHVALWKPATRSV